jgi:hypothetical protein
MINTYDTNSLKNLSIIQENQCIDISSDGTVGAPYGRGMISGVWRTGRSYLSYGNAENIPSLLHLFERAFDAVNRGNGSLVDIDEAIKGLQILKNNYKHKTKVGQEIDGIIEFASKKVTELKSLQKADVNKNLNNKTIEEMTQLEQSYLFANSGPHATEGVEWVAGRIKSFIQSAHISEEDKAVMHQIMTALEDYQRWEECKNWLWSWDPSIGSKESARQRAVSSFLDKLDNQPEEVQRNVGLFIPLSYRYLADNQKVEGHAIATSICKEADGSYTIVHCNAGQDFLKLNLPVEYKFSWNPLFPIEMQGQTTVEFGPLPREEALNFLGRVQAQDLNHLNENEQEIAARYYSIFAPIEKKFKHNTVPFRRLQDIGNCSVRSPLEWSIFCLQKFNKIELANHFLTLSPKRSTFLSPYIDAVKPLPEDLETWTILSG